MSSTDSPTNSGSSRNHGYRSTIGSYFRKPEKLPLSDLSEWYQAYLAQDGNSLEIDHKLIKAVQSDELDQDSIESCLADLSQDILVRKGFCDDCHDLFSNWPNLDDPKVKAPRTDKHWPGSGADWKHAVARDCHTLVLEAAGRKGCKMCGFIVQQMKDCESLEIFRRLEVRLEYLDAKETASLSVQNWAQNSSQLLWINFPGKVNDNCNTGIALVTTFYSTALEANGQ